MQIDLLHVTTQRPATDEEIAEYEALKEIFDSMSPEERAANDIRRVVDLAAEGNPAKHIVYYGTRRVTSFNETFIREVEIPVGKGGANAAIKRAIAATIAEHRRPEHETFHVSGEFSHDGVYIGFKNITARSEFPVRGL